MKAPLIGISRHRIGRDGEGVTTLVAFHGCSLRCWYCLNSQCLSPEGVWKKMSPKEVYNTVRIDNLYFEATGGGVCFGGGEPALQWKFIKEFKKICNSSWKLTIETSLNVPSKNIRELIPVIDKWIVDIKDMDSTIYLFYTQKDNSCVIDNLKQLSEAGADVEIRVPLIPEYNKEEDVERSIKMLTEMGFSNFDRFTYKTKEEQKENLALDGSNISDEVFLVGEIAPNDICPPVEFVVEPRKDENL